jgi:hypothetical protein
MANAVALRVADQVFIAVALLHREFPARADFTVNEIVDRALKEFGPLRPGIRVHIYSHCVANKRPDSGRYRMLYATGENTRRLLQAGDDVHPERAGKTFPDPDDVPPQYHELIAWARSRYSQSGAPSSRWLEGVMQMRGLGRELWKGEDPDEYVRQLREGWE